MSHFLQIFRDRICHQTLGKAENGNKSKLQVLVENCSDDCNYVMPEGPGFRRDPVLLPSGYLTFKEYGQEFRRRLYMRYAPFL